MVNPKLMCSQHLRGEHLETHMMAGSIKKGISVKGYIAKGLMEPHNIRKRHDEVVKELLERGRFNHQKPFPEFVPFEDGCINAEENVKELARRCERCKKRQEEYYGKGE